MGLILDTSALVAIERRGLDAAAFLVEHADESVALPMIVWAELLIGVRMAQSGDRAARRRARLEQLRRHVPLVPFDDLIAERYAEVYRDCARRGKPIPQNDMAVAATALHLGYRVLVANTDEAHFRSVTGLDVVTWPG